MNTVTQVAALVGAARRPVMRIVRRAHLGAGDIGCAHSEWTDFRNPSKIRSRTCSGNPDLISRLTSSTAPGAAAVISANSSVLPPRPATRAIASQLGGLSSLGSSLGSSSRNDRLARSP